LVLVLVATWLLAMSASAWPRTRESSLRFEVSFPSSVRAEPITGRVFVTVSKTGGREPRLEAGGWGDTSPLFGADVEELKPGDAVLIDGSTLGYPPRRLADIPVGDYYVEALINVYTECHRADGHTIWVHLDQWEGQQFNRSPGNLYSEVQQAHLDPGAGYNVKLSLTKVIPPVEYPRTRSG